MRMLHLLEGPAARAALAVAVVLLARSVLRQPYTFVDREGSQQPAPAPNVASSPVPRSAPPLRGTPQVYPMDMVWNQMYLIYGDRLAQAALRSNNAEYLATWQEMGSYLRAHHITTTMFRERMTKLGWPADEQERLMVAAGYIWPSRYGQDEPTPADQ